MATSLLPIIPALLITIFLGASSAQPLLYFGCFKDGSTLVPRVFHVSAGSYDPNTITPNICTTQCSQWGFRYAGLTQGRYCLCSNQLPSVAKDLDANCTSVCTGDAASKCGSHTHISVYEAVVPLRGLHLSMFGKPSAVAVVGEMTYFNLTLVDGPSKANYRMQYGAGGPYSASNETTMLSHVFQASGDAVVSANVIQPSNEMASVAVSVQAPAQVVSLECPEFATTTEEFRCNISVDSGTSLHMSVDYADGTIEEFAVADAAWFAVGSPVAQHGAVDATCASGNTAGVVFLRSSEFLVDGWLKKFEYMVANTSTVPIVFLLLEPTCTTPLPVYCPETGLCQASCSGTIANCATSPVKFCPLTGHCNNSCPVVSRYGQTDSPTSYNVIATFTSNAVVQSNGYAVYSLATPFPVYGNKGYRLAYYTTGSTDCLAGRSTSVADENDLFVSLAPAAGPVSISTATNTPRASFLRAIVVRKTSTVLFHIFQTHGRFNVRVSVQNTLLDNVTYPPQYANASIFAQEAINDSTIDVSPFLTTGKLEIIGLLPHTGSDVTYLWDFGDDSPTRTTYTNYTNHTYVQRGCYNVNNTAYNDVSFRASNITLVCVEDELLNMTVKNSVAAASIDTYFTMTMTSGTDYMCYVSTGDGGTIEDSWLTSPITLSNWSYAYTYEGTYIVNVTCLNNVSVQSVELIQYVQSPITNLRLYRRGAYEMKPYYIVFLIDKGTDPAFTLTFDGVSLPITYDPTTLTGTTLLQPALPLSVHQVVVTGTNMFGTVVLNETTFVIEEPIIGAFSTCSVDNETVTDWNVDYMGNVTSGTSVNVTYEYADGSPPVSVTMPILDRWPHVAFVQSHVFLYGGLFKVKVTVSNHVDIFEFLYNITVFGKIDNITLTSNTPQGIVKGSAKAELWFESPVPPANVQLLFNYADGTPNESLPFNYKTIYHHQYFVPGFYVVIANISNKLNWVLRNTTVVVDYPVVNTRWLLAVPHASKDLPFVFGITADSGPYNNILLDFGDGNGTTVDSLTGGPLGSTVNVTHIFKTLGQFVVKAIVINNVGNITIYYKVVVQVPVPDNLVITSTAPVVFLPGIVNFTLILPAGTPIPTNAFITYVYGDGTESVPIPLTFAVIGGVLTCTATNVFKTDGDFMTTLIVSNLASQQVFSISGGAYMLLDGFSADVRYRPELPLDGDYLPGGGPLQNKFPTTYNITFVLTFTGTPVLYKVYVYTQSGALVMASNQTVRPPSVRITTPGQYTATVSVWNPLSEVSESKSFEVAAAASGVSMSAAPMTANIQTPRIVIVNVTDFGPYTCLGIAFGDGTSEVYGNDSVTCNAAVTGPVNHTVTTTHKYARNNAAFTVTATMHDAVGPCADPTSIIFAVQCTAQSAVTTTASDCSYPTIVIADHAPLFTAPSIVYRSLQLLIDAVVTIDCATTLYNVKEWTCESLDESTGTVLSVVNISTVTLVSNALLSIPPKALPLGLYRFTLRVKVGSSGLFANEETTHIRVTRTPIVANIVANSMSIITRGRNSNITLSPQLYSYDPDIDRNETQGITNYIWLCRQFDERFPTRMDGSLDMSMPSFVPYTDAELSAQPSSASALPGCFRQGPGRIAIDGQGSLTFSGRNMRINDSYVFRVIVIKGDRNTTAEVLVSIVAGHPPTVEIGCLDQLLCRPATGVLIVNPSSRITLGAVCVDTPDACTSDLQYQYTIYRLSLNGAYLPILPCPDFSIGCQSNDIAVSANLYQLGFTVYEGVTDYRVGLVLTNSAGERGLSFIDFKVNTAPAHGNCTISPRAATSALEKFDISCTDWVDRNGIKLYQFYSTVFGSTSETQLGYSYSGSLPPTALGVGPAADNYKVYLHVRIYDTLDAFTVFDFPPVQVNPVSPADAQGTINMLLTAKTSQNPLLVQMAQGDLLATNSLFLAYANLLNQATQYSIEQYGNGSTSYPSGTLLASEGYQEARNDRAVLREMMIESLSNNTIATIQGVQLCSSTLAALTSEPSEVTRRAQLSAVDAVHNIVGTLNTLSPTTAFEDIVVAAQGIAALVGNLYKGINGGVDDGTISDIEAGTKTKFFEYDADWESPRKGFYGMSAADMNKGLKRETNNLAQKDSATGSVPSLMESMDSMSTLILSRLVSDEKPIVIVTQNLNVSLAKSKPQDLVKQPMTSGDASVMMPSNWCEMAPGGINCSSKDPISAKLITTPSNIFTSYPDAGKVATESSIVTFDLYDNSGKRMVIKDTKEPIEIIIPHPTVTPPTAELQYVEMSSEDDRVDLAYFKTNVTVNDSSLHIQIGVVDPEVQLLVLVRYNTYPALNETDGYDYMQLVPVNMANASWYLDRGIDPYTVVLDNSVIKNRVGNWYIGLRQLNNTEVDTYNSQNPPLKPAPFTGRLTTNFTLAIYSSGCYFTAPRMDSWDSKGCLVGPKTTPVKTYCYCNHLTSFGGGFAVQPNTIDFAFVMSHADFLSNPTLYIMEMVVCVLYIFGFIWARWRDKKDLVKHGITPLPDNDPRDKYLYEVIVSTGLRKEAGTDSKVFFVLSGEDEETDGRAFEDDQRKIFRRGATDHFLLAVPRPLGGLHYMRIWHDNSGSGTMASWYLNYILIRDVQTNDKYQFIVNQWFAVEKEDGQISRLIPVAGKDKMVDTEHLFSSKGKKGLTDDHIWFSVFARPARSRFTRLQRLSCCLCLLFTAMLANAMFYGVVSSSTANGFQIGPFSLSAEQVYVGIISNMITFPVNFLIAFLFKRSRPYRKHPSRVKEAVKRMRNRREDAYRKGSTASIGPDGAASQPDLNSSQMELQPRTEKQEASLYAEMWDVNPEDNPDMPEAEKKKRFSLPWWCVIIAWILLWIVVGLCVAFVTFYGIMFQDLKCKKWITSMFISFFTSVILTQPIKVLLLALFFALVFKKPFDDEEPDEMEDEEDPDLGPDELYLHNLDGAPKARTISYSPPDPEALIRARERRQKEMQMFSVLREILIYSFYVWILIIISYEFRDVNSFPFKENMRVAFVSGGSASDTMALTDIQTMDDFWEWLIDTVSPSMRAANWYNGQRPVGLRGFQGDYVSRIMGFATLRQLRIKKGHCSVPSQIRGSISRCRGAYSFDNEDMGTYDVGWTPLPPEINGTQYEPPYEYVYRHGSELDTGPYYGMLEVYSGGGYVAELRGDRSKIIEKIEQLKAEGWIDTYTRAVFLEFAMYNPSVNLFGAVTMIAELMQSGGFTYYYMFTPMNLLGSQSGMAIFYLAIKAIFLLFIVFFLVREIRKMYKQRGAYLKEFWNWVELFVIAVSIGGCVVFAYRYIMTMKLMDIFKQSGGNAYMRFQYVAFWHETLLNMLGLAVFWSTVKFIKLLRFNKTMSMLGSTIQYAAEPLFWFSVTFLIMFFAFMQFFYLTYNSQFFTFSTIVQTTEMCIQMLVGKFDFNELLAGGNLGTLMFFLYMVVCFFIMLTMFVTIVNEAFAAVQDDLKLQSNEHELVDYIVGRFVDFTGLKKLAKKLSEIGQKKKEDEHDVMDTLNERMDRFIECIDGILSGHDDGVAVKKSPAAAAPVAENGNESKSVSTSSINVSHPTPSRPSTGTSAAARPLSAKELPTVEN